MKKTTQRKLLKSIHVLFSAIWLGAVFSMMLLSTVSYVDAEKTLQVILMIKFIDIFVAISAFVTLVSGLLISWLTEWGFKTTWVKVKIIANIVIMVVGWLAILQWERSTYLLSTDQPIVHNTSFFYDILHYNSLAVVLLIAVFIISVFKPWAKKRCQNC